MITLTGPVAYVQLGLLKTRMQFNFCMLLIDVKKVKPTCGVTLEVRPPCLLLVCVGRHTTSLLIPVLDSQSKVLV